MKPFLKMLIMLVFATSAFCNDNEKLFPIINGNQYCYIDITGKTVIEPRFIVAEKFSEDLAPVRLNGTYGYIDTKGKYIIPSKYDMALAFNFGLAKVFIDGKPYFIDNKGNILFNHNYINISDFGNHSFAIAITPSGKYGVIDKSGKLLVDTVYAIISDFTNGVAVVTGLNHKSSSNDSTKNNNYEKGVIDSLGNLIVKYGDYKDIGEFKNGYALVELIVKRQKGYYDHEGIIDEKGKYKFTVPSKKWNFDYSIKSFYQDIAIVDIHSVDPDNIKAVTSNSSDGYKGAINPNGEIIFSNSEWVEITPFTFNRAFAKTRQGHWFLIDTKGKVVISQSFDNILYDTFQAQPEYLFQNAMAFVKTTKGWGAIDTLGGFIVEPTELKNVKDNSLFRRGNVVFFFEDISTTNRKYPYCYGFWNTTNNVIVKPIYHAIDINGFDDGLIYVMQDDQISYINQAGKLVYKGNDSINNKKLNIDYMNRGYYYASSKYKKELDGLGGWGKSKNSSKIITIDSTFSSNTLQIIIDTNQKSKWADIYDGIKLFVANTSKDPLYFYAQDSRLYLQIQAQDRTGEWNDIEYLPSSWCGNSFHCLFLAPKELWEFTTPIYHGEFKTKLRAQLLYKKDLSKDNNDIIYSNEIDGYINPGQFWNKREYHPKGIMDSYND